MSPTPVASPDALKSAVLPPFAKMCVCGDTAYVAKSRIATCQASLDHRTLGERGTEGSLVGPSGGPEHRQPAPSNWKVRCGTVR